MKNIIKIICIILISVFVFTQTNVFAAVDISNIKGIENIENSSIKGIGVKDDLSENIEAVGFKVLTMIKYFISGLLIIFLVYVGMQMIMSMGTDEEQLSSSKRQLRYSIVALIFINIPGAIYEIFNADKLFIGESIHGTWSNQISTYGDNLFIELNMFNDTINGGIVTFIEAVIFTIAIFMITLAGIRIIASRGKEEDVTESKNKIIWSIVGLVFIGFIESWQTLVYNGNIEDGSNLFQTLENLALFFAGPVGIFFLTLSGYYYITSNGDEEKVKKAKSIITYTLLATIILLASHSFLKDLLTLNF